MYKIQCFVQYFNIRMECWKRHTVWSCSEINYKSFTEVLRILLSLFLSFVVVVVLSVLFTERCKVMLANGSFHFGSVWYFFFFSYFFCVERFSILPQKLKTIKGNLFWNDTSVMMDIFEASLFFIFIFQSIARVCPKSDFLYVDNNNQQRK